MNSRQLTWLGVAAIAIILGAIWVGMQRTPGTESSAALYPALKNELAKAQAVRVYSAGDHLSVELKRTATGWTLTQRNEYLADTAKISALLISLERAKIREEKTSNPDNYVTLGVQDLKTPGASGGRIELVGIDPPVDLIVGKADATARASYVRRQGESKSWLVSEQLTIATDAASWLQRDLFSVGADRIQEVAVQLSGSPRYSAIKAKRADANFDVTPLPAKRELNSVGAANSVAQSLVGLQLDDVRPLTEVADHKAIAQASFRTFDGLVIDISGYAIDGKKWIAAKARIDEALAKRFYLPATTATPVTTGTKDPAAKTDDSIESATAKVRAEVDALNKQLSEWCYAIAPYKYDAIFKPVDDLLRKL